MKDAEIRQGAAELHMSDFQHEQLISNLLVVICSGERVRQVLQAQSGRHRRNRF